MMAWTLPADVAARWIGELPVPEQYISTAIEDVEDQLIVMAPDLVDEFGASVPLERVKRIVARVIVRHLQNPEGVRVRSEATGPVTGSVTYSGDDPGALTVTMDDIADLRGKSFTDGAYAISMINPRSFQLRALSEPDPWRTY